MHHITNSSRGVGLLLEVGVDRLLFPVAIGLALTFGGAVLTF